MPSSKGSWVKHPDKHIQGLLAELNDQGWMIVSPPKYYRAFCPCPVKHRKWIHITPSDPYYLNKVKQYLRNHTCYAESGKRNG